jgi:hypothetical protein
MLTPVGLRLFAAFLLSAATDAASGLLHFSRSSHKI